MERRDIFWTFWVRGSWRRGAPFHFHNSYNCIPLLTLLEEAAQCHGKRMSPGVWQTCHQLCHDAKGAEALWNSSLWNPSHVKFGWLLSASNVIMKMCQPTRLLLDTQKSWWHGRHSSCIQFQPLLWTLRWLPRSPGMALGSQRSLGCSNPDCHLEVRELKPS